MNYSLEVSAANSFLMSNSENSLMNNNLLKPECSCFLEKRDLIELNVVMPFNETHIKIELNIKYIGQSLYASDFLKCEKGMFSGDLK